MKIIKESYSVSPEDIFRQINKVKLTYNNFIDSIRSLSFYLSESNHQDESEELDYNANVLIPEDLQSFFWTLDDIKDMLSSNEDDEDDLEV